MNKEELKTEIENCLFAFSLGFVIAAAMALTNAALNHLGVAGILNAVLTVVMIPVSGTAFFKLLEPDKTVAEILNDVADID